MVVRKPVATPRGQAAQGIPYPTVPTPPREGKLRIPVQLKSTNLERYTAGTDKVDRGSHAKDDVHRRQGQEEGTIEYEIPLSFEVGRGIPNAQIKKNQDLPAVLRPGSTEVTPRSSWESQGSASSDANASSTKAPQPVDGAINQLKEARSRSTSNNPYRHMRNTNGQTPEKAESDGKGSAEIRGRDMLSDQSHRESTRLGQPLAEPRMQLGTSQGEQRPEQERSLHMLDNKAYYNPINGTIPNFIDQKASEAPEVPLQPPVPPRYQNSQFTVLGQASMDSRNDAIQNPTPSNNIMIGDNTRYPSHDIGVESQAFSSLPSKLHIHSTNEVGQDASVPMSNSAQTPMQPSHDKEVVPALAPSRADEKQRIPPRQPPRPPKADEKSGENIPTGSEMQAQREEAVKTTRNKETYQIRHVNWYDASSPTNPRRSPIMVQNANGPCPLLALVNALVLSTPSNFTTGLVETLRVREQVSLGLLMDAVIEELLSSRRGDTAGNLPDVTDLFAFLVALHTGMNVNPRFVPVDEAVNLMDAPIDGDLPTNLHQARKAGGFEDTREMKLYSTFAIPLIHGWIPPRNHPAFAALKRSAQTYEDAQNLMFREEELEEKLQREGLTQEEETILQDIASVKYFVNSTATQLTGYGLDTMTETLAPGSIAILFRNDHFSTLYRHPRSGQLLTLVTDMGYAGHDEVVWESLVDVSGEGCEFFSGDFRPVGNVAGDIQQQPQQPSPRSSEDDSGWTTVDSKSRRTPRANRSGSGPNLTSLSTLNISDESTPLSPNTEQEDHDLALAMQLQEEEEERDRQEAAARRREDELSQQYLNSSDSSGRRTFPGFGRGAQSGPSPPPRGSGRGRFAPPPRKSTDTSEDPPPPSYEQAAKGPAYIPPASHPAHPLASPNSSRSTPKPQGQRPRQSSAYSEHAASFGGSPTYGPGSSRRGHIPRISTGPRGGVEPNMVRRRSGPPGSAALSEDDKKDKDCVVM